MGIHEVRLAVSHAGIYEVCFAVSYAGIYEVRFAVSHAMVSPLVIHDLTRTVRRWPDCLYSIVRNCSLHFTYIQQNKSVCKQIKCLDICI